MVSNFRDLLGASQSPWPLGLGLGRGFKETINTYNIMSQNILLTFSAAFSWPSERMSLETVVVSML